MGLHDVREYTQNKHRNVDDNPYGGGPGMVMNAAPVVAAIEAAKKHNPDGRTVLLSPAGRLFDQTVAREWATEQRGLILVCGRYEGIDARVADHFCDDEVSIGDYVLSGGELAALVIMDAVTRLLPGVLGNSESPVEESLSNGLLEYPHYTRPRDFRSHQVPDVLLSGDHQSISKWRRRKALERTRTMRPDLFETLELKKEDKKLLET
jgi:tRNA (guanine37-N1)-methyltransferase